MSGADWDRLLILFIRAAVLVMLGLNLYYRLTSRGWGTGLS